MRGEGRDRGQGRRRWISNMLGQMHGPTVVCHSCRFRSFRYLFPLNVLLSPFTSSSPASLFLSFSFSMSLPRPSLPSYAFLPLIMRFSRSLPSQGPLSIGCFFPLRHVITVSTVACTRITYRHRGGLGILFYDVRRSALS